MYTIRARNVNDAFVEGMRLLRAEGDNQPSRDGPVRALPMPMTTVYERPWERVLFSPIRDANPFFHLFESMWMLAGSDDGVWLDRYVRDFSSRFGEPSSGSIWGAYGHRWRRTFELTGARMGTDSYPEWESDQLDRAVRLLRANPTSRQVVVSMWDPTMDLGTVARDRPCNTHIYLRIREGALDTTVCCRSNDMVMGAYGANAVHMSVLHEYLAARIGCPMGTYYQVSNDMHAYQRDLDRYVGHVWSRRDTNNAYETGLVDHRDLFSGGDMSTLDREIAAWVARPDECPVNNNPQLFEELLIPMHTAHTLHKQGSSGSALDVLEMVTHSDWKLAAQLWINRRTRS